MGLLKNNNDLKTLKWVYQNTKKYFPLVYLIAFLSALTAVMGVVLALVSKNVLDVATNAKEGSIVASSITLIAVILVQILSSFSTSFLKDYTTAKLTILLRKKIYTLITKRKFSEIVKYHSGDILNRITSDTDVVISSVVNIIPRIVAMLVKIIGCIWVLLVLDPMIAILSLSLGIFIPAIGRIFSKKYKYLHKEGQKAEGKVRSFMQESFENIVVVKVFSNQSPFLKKLDEYMHKNFIIKMKRAVVSIFIKFGLFSFFSLGYYVVMIWGAIQISKGIITYGTLMAFLQLVSQIRGPLESVSGIIPQFYSTIASAERVIELEKGDLDSESKGTEELEGIGNNFEFLKVDDISFSYDDESVLENCSFVVEKGKITAIVGESGSGKSTIFKIILGLYEPQKGNITINGKIKLDTSLRGLFAYVPQGNLVLSGTIRENLTLGNNDISEEQLINATKVAEIYELIKSMPDGFETELGERGAGLSEGQIQRISIARALLTDAPILLFDEATSALDETTESKLLSNIRSLESKTVIFVTHRHTSLKICDSIIHCEDKKFSVIK